MATTKPATFTAIIIDFLMQFHLYLHFFICECEKLREGKIEKVREDIRYNAVNFVP